MAIALENNRMAAKALPVLGIASCYTDNLEPWDEREY